jgi:P27 family predicted phage terminase small subunit
MGVWIPAEMVIRLPRGCFTREAPTFFVSEVQVSSKPKPAPEFFSTEGKRIWRDTVTQMAVHGIHDPADAMTLETYVFAVLRQRMIAAEVRKRPLLTNDGKISPLVRAAEATAGTVRNLARVLGLSPTARQRLPRAPQKQGGNKWSDL